MFFFFDTFVPFHFHYFFNLESLWIIDPGPYVMISSTIFFFFFEVVPYFVALVGLKLTVYPRLALVFQQLFSLCLLSIRITSLHRHTWAVKYFFKHDNSEEKTCDKPVRGGLVWHPWKHEVGGERSFVTQVFYEVPVTENCVPLRNIVSLHETQLKPWFVCVLCVCFPFLSTQGFLSHPLEDLCSS